MSVILDACAIIAFYNGESGADAVEQYLNTEECFLHAVNAMEVYYLIFRKNTEEAKQLIKELGDLGIIIRSDMDENFWKTAGEYKVLLSIPIGDSFLAALSKRIGAPIITGDKNDGDKIRSTGLDVRYFR